MIVDNSQPNQSIVSRQRTERNVMWDAKTDSRLLKLKGDGLSFQEISERMGVSRNAAIGRAQRLAGKIFPSQARRSEFKNLEIKQRRQKSAHEREAIVEMVRESISSGMPRPEVIQVALACPGATYQIVGDALGISKQYVHQLAHVAA